jgi:hypothetical protein
MMCTAIASTIAMLIATMTRKNFPIDISEAHTPGTG